MPQNLDTTVERMMARDKFKIGDRVRITDEAADSLASGNSKNKHRRGLMATVVGFPGDNERLVRLSIDGYAEPKRYHMGFW
jgi:hypothetical protein